MLNYYPSSVLSLQALTLTANCCIGWKYLIANRASILLKNNIWGTQNRNAYKKGEKNDKNI